jgi:external thioesterase TEII
MSMLIKEKQSAIKVLRESTSETCLICFPYAGSNWSAFVPLIKHLNIDLNIISISPPGFPGDARPVLESIDEMADLYMEELKPHLRKNVILWGYSMGGLVVHCILNKLREIEWDCNVAAIISASIPPHLISEAQKISGFDNDEVIQFFHSIGGIPSVILKEKELLEMFLPFLKSDYKAFENYATDKTEKFDVPAYIIYGKHDNFISSDDFLQWEEYFDYPLKVYHVDGGHLFIKDNPVGLANIIKEIVSSVQTTSF